MKNIPPSYYPLIATILSTVMGLLLASVLPFGIVPGSSLSSSGEAETTYTPPPVETTVVTPAPDEETTSPTTTTEETTSVEEPQEPTSTVPEPGDALPALDQRDSVVAVGTAQRGEIIGTSGKPAIALRFDHHLGDFENKVLPLLEKYRLPWGQMLNGGIIEQEGMSADQLAEAAHNTGGEVWNHGWSHASIFTPGDADREITDGLAALQDAFPSLWIDGWAQPGQPSYMGLENIPSSAEDYFETYPGRLILNQHAFIRGYYPDTYHELEGSNLIGQGHVTIDKQKDGRIQQYIRRALSGGTGVTLMLHPNYLDRTGFITTNELDAALAYIAHLRDTDQIEVLSTTGILLAEDDLPEDNGNLLDDGSAGEIEGVSVNEVPRALDYLGVPHEAEVWVSGTGTATLTVEVGSGSFPVTTTYSVELTDKLQRMSVLVTPPMDTTSVTVSLTGTGAHDGISYQPL